MKFIHVADLHLDSPFKGLANSKMPTTLLQQMQQSTFDAATKVFDAAIDNQVDFVLLVGDLFDRAEQSINAKYFLNQQLNRLNNAQIPVLISFGNHDYFAGDIKQLGFPENVFVFPNVVTTTKLTLKDGTIVAISGFSFANQWVSERMITNYPQADSQVDWNLGMLHGSAEGINSTEGTYAPFSLAEINAKNYDYWALGHIHQRQSLDERRVINYSGNTQGRHINEAGSKGCLLVESQGEQLTTKFISTATIEWQRITITLTVQPVTEMVAYILEQLSKKNFTKMNFIRVEVTGTISSEQQQAIINGQLLPLLQDANAKLLSEYNFWVTSIKLLPSPVQLGSQEERQSFEEAKIAALTNDNFQLLLNNFDQESFIKEELDSPAIQAEVSDLAAQILEQHLAEKGTAERDN
ncbi:DNA repair exonuclease [Lentilactobacillus senioris]|uniref:metallophosphoesterase family protein n=1 Tax=Lentilactobacillus senioris TaxID=931534 RepID=UPI0022823FA2|nr:DNA repair exonuclease [Lentilactobacillus senioris]MCY9806978.1 DNA repair exonuclease [Lentilactobacillus senioris]